MGGILVTQQSKYVNVVDGGANDNRAAAHVFQQLVASLEQFSFLKAQLCRQLLHLGHEQVHELMGVAVKDLPNLADVFPIALWRY